MEGAKSRKVAACEARFATTSSDSKKIENALPLSWVDRTFPRKLALYIQLARMEKPIGSWLLMLPCWWGTALGTAPGHLPSAKLMALFMCGSILMRGSGCTINDIWDRDIDSKVERTKTRPLVVQDNLSLREAMSFLSLQLAGGLLVLYHLNEYTKVLSLAAMPLVVVYPLMKRITPIPQLWLGMVFNWGILVGYAANHGSLDLSVVAPLYLSAVTWTVIYDTIYAHQDKTDDVRVGVGSSALLFGSNSSYILSGLALSMVTSLGITGYQADLAAPYYVVGVGGALAHLTWQLRTVDYDDPRSCGGKFVSNQWLGLLIFLGLVLGRWCQSPEDLTEIDGQKKDS